MKRKQSTLFHDFTLILISTLSAIILVLGFVFWSNYQYLQGSSLNHMTLPQLSITPPNDADTFQVLKNKNIASVTTDAPKIYKESNFPYGLFNDNAYEWGLINYSNDMVGVTITFTHPVSIFSIESVFSHCPAKSYPNGYTGTTGCYYSLGVKGKTVNDKSFYLIYPNTVYPKTMIDGIGIDVLDNTYYIDTSLQLTQIILTAQRFGEDFNNYVHWKKIYITYAK